MSTIENATRPMLTAKVQLRNDPIDGEPILLYPEGVLKLNSSASAVLALCDGSRSLQEILALLGKRFEAPPETLRNDVVECLSVFARRQFISLRHE